MANPTYAEELLEELRKLGEVERRRVLEFARSLSARRPPRGSRADDVLKHLGVLGEDAANEIAVAIEEGCEKVNEDAW